MSPRLIKQIIYGAGYLAVIFLIIFVIYLIWFKPAPSCFDNKQNQGELGIDCGGPCPACEIRNLKPFQVSWIKYFISGDKLIIAAEIKNPNFNYGADYFDYNLDIYGLGGDKIKSLSGNSFIYAGEIKSFLKFDSISSAGIKEIKISFSSINWKSSLEFPEPKIQTREISIDLTKPISINGVIVNENPFVLSKITSIGFLFNKYGIPLAASMTEIDNLQAFKEQSFKIIFPLEINIQDISPSSTKTFIEAKR